MSQTEAVLQVNPHGGSHTDIGGDPVPVVTTTVNGLMSAVDKVKLNSLGSGNIIFAIRNETGVTIAANKLVSAVGFDVGSGKTLIQLADKDDSAKRPALGVTILPLLTGEDGDILVHGKLTNVDTSAYSITDQLVLGNNGNFSRPPPDEVTFLTGEVQNVGSVVRVDAALGAINISVDGLSLLTALEKLALEGTSGTPSDTNKYVTNSDTRLAPAVLLWGAETIAAAADTRYLATGNTAAATTSASFSFRIPRAGIFRKLRVRHNSAVGNGESVVYFLRVNTVNTALTATLASGAIGDASDLTNSVTVAAGDLIEVVAVKALSLGNGGLQVILSIEFDA